MKGSNPLSVLEADLRLLSGESRKAESLTGQLTGWLSGPEHPQLRETAERALLKLRTPLDPGDDEAAVRQRKVKTDLTAFQILHHAVCPALLSVQCHWMHDRKVWAGG